MASISWDTGEVKALAADLGKAGIQTTRLAGQVVRKAAHDVQSQAKSRAAVDTGAMRNSISTQMSGPLSATIGPSASYAVYLEGGTRYMAARPFMGPAADAVEPAFIAAMEKLGGEIL